MCSAHFHDSASSYFSMRGAGVVFTTGGRWDHLDSVEVDFSPPKQEIQQLSVTV